MNRWKYPILALLALLIAACATAPSPISTVKHLPVRDLGIDAFTEAYLRTALWDGRTPSGNYLDAVYRLTDLPAEVVERAREDCARFRQQNARDLAALGNTDAMNGSQFYLSRNVRGSRFYNLKDTAVGLRLGEAAYALGRAVLEVSPEGGLQWRR